MRNVCKHLESLSHLSFKELALVKTTVRIVKQGNWNNDFPYGFYLIQEVQTRFGTTLSVEERFLKSIKHVKYVLQEKGPGAASEAYGQLTTGYKSNCTVSHPGI